MESLHFIYAKYITFIGNVVIFTVLIEEYAL